MLTVWFAVLLIGLYLGTMWSFYVWTTKQKANNFAERLHIGGGIFVSGGFMLALFGASVLFFNPSVSVYALSVAVLLLLMYCANRFQKRRQKALWIPVFSVLGMVLLHQAMPDLQMSVVQIGVGTIIWAGMMGVVMYLDRLPLLNFLTFGTWSLAFITAYVLNVSGVPPMIACVGAALLAPLWGVLNALVRYMEGRLGPYVSALLGFVMGGILTICVLLSAYGSALMLTGYYLFEGVLLGLTYMGFKPLGLRKGQFAFEKMLLEKNPTPAVKVVFFRLLILSLLAVLMWRVNYLSILSLMLVVILLDTYNRFSGAGAPAPKIRDVWKETKQALKQLWQQYTTKDQKSESQPAIVKKEKTKKATRKISPKKEKKAKQ